MEKRQRRENRTPNKRAKLPRDAKAEEREDLFGCTDTADKAAAGAEPAAADLLDNKGERS
jgi:hypothetical protein